MKNKTFTVFALYLDNKQRHGSTVKAKDATDAQKIFARRMKRKGHDMLIAAVVEGDVKALDAQSNGEWPSISNIEHAG